MMLCALTIGIVIQITIFILCWLICNLINKRLWIIAKVVVYFCLDVIIPCTPFMIGFLLSGGNNTPNSNFLFHALFDLPILILISKVAFFKFYKKRFALQDC